MAIVHPNRPSPVPSPSLSGSVALSSARRVGGFPRDLFVSADLTDFTCIICTDIIREAVESRKCGHIFCSSCLLEALAHSPRCPTCREPMANSDIQTSLYIRRQIGNLKVKCPHKDEGCGWSESLVQLDNHLGACEFTTVQCIHCPSSFPRKDKFDHDQNECPYRFENDETYVPCPRQCGCAPFMRKQLKAHAEVCPFEPTSCPYSRYGCKFMGIRKDMSQHTSNAEQTAIHLDMADTAFLRLLEETTMKDREREARDAEEHKEFMQEMKNSIQPNSFVDVRDSMSMWLPAQVLKRQGNMVFIHYLNWESRWDEWLDLSSTDRIAKFKSHTGGPQSDKFKVGQWVEVYAQLTANVPHQWVAGVVQQVVGRRICVSLENYPSHIAYWIMDNDKKIIPIGKQRPAILPNDLSNPLWVKPTSQPSTANMPASLSANADTVNRAIARSVPLPSPVSQPRSLASLELSPQPIMSSQSSAVESIASPSPSRQVPSAAHAILVADERKGVPPQPNGHQQQPLPHISGASQQSGQGVSIVISPPQSNQHLTYAALTPEYNQPLAYARDRIQAQATSSTSFSSPNHLNGRGLPSGAASSPQALNGRGHSNGHGFGARGRQ